MPRETLAEALAGLDALMADASCPPDGDLRTLVRQVGREVEPLAQRRGICLVMDVRGREPLTGRDLRRWRYLLTHAVLSFVEDLPPGSGLRVGVACAATTCGHRWLQADVAARLGSGEEPETEPRSSDGGRRMVLVETALRLLDGACDRAESADGPVLRLVAPVEA
jgi:hypothetical protein